MAIKESLDSALDLHRAGRLDEAAIAYRKLLDADPENADGLYGLGTVLMQSGDAEQAADLLYKAATLVPDSPEIAYNSAMVAEMLGQAQPAVTLYIRAANLAGGEPDIVVPACRKLLSLGAPAAALTILRGLDSPTTVTDTLAAQAQAAAGDWPGAVEKLRRFLEQGAADASAWRDIATAAARIQDFETALKAFEAWLAAGEPSGNDYIDYADLLLAVRDLDGAESALLDNEIDNRGRAEVMLAKIARLRNDMESSRKHLLAAIDAEPANAEAWNLLTEIEPPDTLADVAERVHALARGGDGREAHRITLALAAGRAYDRLGRYSEAFAEYGFGNGLQKQLLLRSGRGYRPDLTERNFDGIMQRFASPVSRQDVEHAPAQPIFIVGMPRSGTTMMERILACLDGVDAGGEIMAMEFVAAELYRSVQSAGQVDLQPPQRQALVDRYWEWAGRKPGLVTDKMPHNFRNVGLIARLFPASPVIYMRRDPRDVCLSIYSRYLMDGHPYACDLEWLGHFYSQSVRIMKFWQRVCPEHVLEVTYEGLVDDLEAGTRRIAEFCRLDWSPDCLDFQQHAGSSFTFSEVQVRKPLNRAGIGRWQHYERELAPLSKLLTDNNLI